MTSEQHDRTFASRVRAALPNVLPKFLQQQRWFGGKARAIRATEVVDIVRAATEPAVFIVFIRVFYEDLSSQLYALPLEPLDGRNLAAPKYGPAFDLPGDGGSPPVTLADALWERRFSLWLLKAIERGETMAGERTKIVARSTRAFQEIGTGVDAEPSVLRGEQSNTSVIYGQRLILKFFRHVEQGVNPDLEVGTFLTEKTNFAHIPRVAGFLEFRPVEGEPGCLGILQAFVPNQGDAWKYTLAEVASYFDRVSTDGGVAPSFSPAVVGLKAGATLKSGQYPSGPVFDLPPGHPSPEVEAWIGNYLADAALLGQRTAELHAALASNAADPAFSPEPFLSEDRAALAQSMLRLSEHVFSLLRGRLSGFDSTQRPAAEKVLNGQSDIRERFETFGRRELQVRRTRIHGDYHLGQVLRTSGDFVIIDFEGEPARPLAERRAKRLPLQDVAGMLRSFHYAAYTGLAHYAEKSGHLPASASEVFAMLWYTWISLFFLRAYFEFSAGAVFTPRSREETRLLLESFLLEKAIYELGYELNNRPDWVGLPLKGILSLLES